MVHGSSSYDDVDGVRQGVSGVKGSPTYPPTQIIIEESRVILFTNTVYFFAGTYLRPDFYTMPNPKRVIVVSLMLILLGANQCIEQSQHDDLSKIMKVVTKQPHSRAMQGYLDLLGRPNCWKFWLMRKSWRYCNAFHMYYPLRDLYVDPTKLGIFPNYAKLGTKIFRFIHELMRVERTMGKIEGLYVINGWFKIEVMHCTCYAYEAKPLVDMKMIHIQGVEDPVKLQEVKTMLQGANLDIVVLSVYTINSGHVSHKLDTIIFTS